MSRSNTRDKVLRDLTSQVQKERWEERDSRITNIMEDKGR